MRKWFIALVALAACSASYAGQTLTYTDLVKRLTDLEALSVLPVVGETCAQFSSYDRASKYDDATGKYVKWDANGDSHGIVREENGQQVLAEMKGPGCIWRIWSARPKEGKVRIYLDGSATPAVDLAFTEYFDQQHAPFVYPALVNYMGYGANCYIPIPFQKSCKVVADDGWGAYYHFTYSTFPEGTVVPTFTRDLSAAERLALSVANKKLTDGLDVTPTYAAKGSTSGKIDGDLYPGSTQNLASVRGEMAITSIKVKLDPEQVKKNPELLRELVLRIYWDEEKEPSVWCPLGDFFGTAPGANHYKSLPLGITDDGMYSHWYMPFSSARVELINEGKNKVHISTEILCSAVTRDPATLGRFHAKWHRDAFLPKEPERQIDWPMLKATGPGRFCGVMLHIFNPKGGWWGEGDEKFFVDDEKFPSTFGTGSEDYFGYAWSNPELFENAYHNQTYNEAKNAGNVSVNRWHITDNVPFQHSFEGDIEKYYANDRPTLYACTVYWYQAPGRLDRYRAIPLSERIGYYEPSSASASAAE